MSDIRVEKANSYEELDEAFNFILKEYGLSLDELLKDRHFATIYNGESVFLNLPPMLLLGEIIGTYLAQVSQFLDEGDSKYGYPAHELIEKSIFNPLD